MKTISLKIVLVFVLGNLLFAYSLTAQSKEIAVDPFNKVTISPHIRATFIKGDRENVSIEDAAVSQDKIYVEVKGKTLRIYLEGAKEVTKSKEEYKNGYQRSHSIYNGTMLTVTVTYRELDELSLRGEETFVCKSPLVGDSFDLKIYGESQVFLEAVDLQRLTATIYGESYLEIRSGNIADQKYTAYGETNVNTLAVGNSTTKLTAFGEGSFRVKVSDRLKVTAFGEATVAYEGDPEVDKGLVIGEATIQKLN
ncbi:MAG: head GIN domain-containing protein [Sediminicola sp.]